MKKIEKKIPLVSNVLFILLGICMIGLLIAPIVTKKNEITLNNPLGRILIGVVLLNILIWSVMAVIQIGTEVQTKGINVFVHEIVRIVILFGIIFVVGKYGYKNLKDVCYALYIALGLEIVWKGMEYRKSIKEKMSQEETRYFKGFKC